jgi:hypothetical protein
MKEKEIEIFRKLNGQLEGLYDEMSALSKKTPTDAINKFKLKFVNQLLLEINALLNDEYKPFTEFIKFEEDDLPTNSDVVLMLSQYLNCMEKLRDDNIALDDEGDWCWVINKKMSDIQTSPPKKI